MALLPFALASGCASPGPPENFAGAKRLATRHSASHKGGAYERNVLVHYYQEHAAPYLGACMEALDQPDRSAFKLVLAISADGSVADVFLRESHNTSFCFAEKLRSMSFPPPPFPVFYEEILMGPWE